MSDVDEPTAHGDERGWRPDPALPSRKRYWDGTAWTRHVHDAVGQYEEIYLGPGGARWQYGVVSIGSFRTPEKLTAALAHLGELGWELITVYDKGSNWLQGYEQGFVLFKRPVAAGTRLRPDEWCINVRL